MNQLTEYSEKNLNDFFKPEEICFVIEKRCDWIDEDSTTTDNIEEAKEYAEENEAKIFIFRKKLVKHCFHAYLLLEDLLDNLEYEGLSRDYVYNCIGEDKETEFIEMTSKWFEQIVGDAWFADELLGELKE